VFSGVLLCWPLLDGPGRLGVLAAALLALPIQVAAFAGLRWGWSGRRFFAAWALGMSARMAAVAAALVMVLASNLPPAPTLLAVASFLFGMLLIEPFFLGRDLTRPVRS
jgi:hypothetical protein